MFTPSKRALFGTISVLACVATIGLIFVRIQESKRPRRVFITYAEKYRTAGGPTTDRPTENNEVFAEERLNHACFVLTRNKPKADYLVNIQVTRYMDGDIFGEATLNIVNAHGEVVLAETFFQDKTSKEDIAQQPITETGHTLCAPPSGGVK